MNSDRDQTKNKELNRLMDLAGIQSDLPDSNHISESLEILNKLPNEVQNWLYSNFETLQEKYQNVEDLDILGEHLVKEYENYKLLSEEENEDLEVAISFARDLIKKGIKSTKEIYSLLVSELKKHGHDIYVAQDLADDALLSLNLTESEDTQDRLDLAFLDYTKSSDKSSTTFDRIVGKYNINPVEFEEYIKEKSKTESFLDRTTKFKKKL